MSCPWNRTTPSVRSVRRRISRARVDLPQPLSPTIASVSPLTTLKLTPSTALTVRPPPGSSDLDVGKYFFSPSTSRILVFSTCAMARSLSGNVLFKRGFPAGDPVSCRNLRQRRFLCAAMLVSEGAAGRKAAARPHLGPAWHPNADGRQPADIGIQPRDGTEQAQRVG